MMKLIDHEKELLAEQNQENDEREKRLAEYNERKEEKLRKRAEKEKLEMELAAGVEGEE